MKTCLTADDLVRASAGGIASSGRGRPRRVPDWEGERRVRYIICAVAADAGYTDDDILGSCRVGPLVEARHIAMHLARKFTGLSHVYLAELFSKSKHSLIQHAINSVNNRVETEPRFAARVRQWEARIAREFDPAHGVKFRPAPNGKPVEITLYPNLNP